MVYNINEIQISTSTLESLTGPNGIVSIQHLSATAKQISNEIKEILFTEKKKYDLQDQINTYLNFHLRITDRT